MCSSGAKTESPPPITMVQLYTAFTCKLLMQYLSSHKAEDRSLHKIQSLEDLPADVKKQLLNLCRLSWQGLVRQQLTFSSDTVGGDTLGLMHEVKELYGGEDSQITYDFIHLTLQEFLSAYHLTQLPPEKQAQLIEQYANTGHFHMAIRFYMGLTKLNDFTSQLILKQISHSYKKDPEVYHWLSEIPSKKSDILQAGSVNVRSSHQWSTLDNFVIGYCIASYACPWHLNFNSGSCGDEGMEMLVRGMSGSKNASQNSGKIMTADFSLSDLTAEGMKWFSNIPPQIIQEVHTVDFSFNELDQEALAIFSDVIPRLTKLQILLFAGNQFGEGWAVRVFESLHHSHKLKHLDIHDTGIGKTDASPLIFLLALRLSMDGYLLPFIMKHPLPFECLHTLDLSLSVLSGEAINSLTSLLQQSSLRVNKLDVRECSINSEGAVQLAAALVDNKWLTELNISHNKLNTDNQGVGLSAFGDMLSTNTSLEKLNMNGCFFDYPEGGEQLLAGLAHNTALRVFWVWDCKLNVKSVCALIEQNTTLQVLDLGYNPHLCEDGNELMVLSSLKKNTALQKLRLPYQFDHPVDPRVE